MKTLGLAAVIATFVSSAAFARTVTKELNFYGEEFRSGEINLTVELENQFRNLDLYDAELIDVELNAKSSSFREATARLIAGSFRSRAEYLSNRYERVFFDVDGRRTFGDWELRFEGNVQVRTIRVTFETDGNGNGNGRDLELVRYINGGYHRVTTDNVSGYWNFEHSFGYLMDSRRNNTQPLYECLVGSKDYMISLQRGCEGQRYVGTLGYIHKSYAAGRVELFRCVQTGNGDHFVSNQRSCEGQRSEGSLGFIDQN